MAAAVHERGCCCIVLCGVSGCGKTTVGRSLGALLGAAFIDADDLHVPEAKSKMTSGVPLTDADRAPWLQRVASAAAAQLLGCVVLGRLTNVTVHANAGSAYANARQIGASRGVPQVVLACSALRRAYRDALRSGVPGRVLFLLLDVDAEVLRERLEDRARAGAHFMPAALLESQLSTLEFGEDLVRIETGTSDAETVAAKALKACQSEGLLPGNEREQGVS